MKFIPLIVISFGLVAGLAAAAPAQDAPAAGNAALNAQTYVTSLVKYMSSPDARLRFSVREGLQVMGPQAVSAINAAMAKETDKHVKAFMSRTVARIKSAGRDRGQQGQQAGRRGAMARGGRNREIDIDRVAMEANLTWEQIDAAGPILKKAQKDMADLMAEFRDAGGNFRDRDAMQDLREEMNAIAKEAEPKLKKENFTEAQIKQLARYLNPMAGRMGRMGGRGERGGERGGQRGGQRGGRRGGEGGGERPIR